MVLRKHLIIGQLIFFSFHWSPSVGKSHMTPVFFIKTMESYKVSLVTRLCGPCIAAIADFLFFFFLNRCFLKMGSMKLVKSASNGVAYSGNISQMQTTLECLVSMKNLEIQRINYYGCSKVELLISRVLR